MVKRSAGSSTEQAAALSGYSQFLCNWLAHNPHAYARLAESGVLDDAHIDPVDDAPSPEDEDFYRALRIYRHTTLAAIAWRDLAGVDDLDANLAALTRLAERCIEAGLQYAERMVAARHGVLCAPSGRPVRLSVVGMGKIGGRELNFSSDIDLIFSYVETATSDGRRPLDADAYLKRVARQLIHVLNASTAHGFVYRVDTRLRPFGDSGALVTRIGAMENYYQAHGREWERYAWVKARPVAGDIAGGRLLIRRLRPFVYRRYLDYGTFESIRDMKTLIDRQVARAELQDNIKLGSGGIREIEFVVQAFQLIRGGQEPVLQDNRLLPALACLAAHGHLDASTATALERSYRCLRRTENRLQMWLDQQTHELPDSAQQRQALAASMGFVDWPTFAEALTAVRRTVHRVFKRVFAEGEQQAPDAGPDVDALQAFWEGELNADDSARLLAAYGITDVAAVQAAIVSLQGQSRYRELQDRGRRWLLRLVPLLFMTAARTEAPDRALIRTLPVLDAIMGRSTYVALLVEYPEGLQTLMRLCAASPWISGHISQQPVLLDSLIETRHLYHPDERRQLAAALAAELEALPEQDLERKMDLLRRFAQREMLRIAAADVSNAMPLMIVSDQLTDLAEVVLEAALAMAWEQMSERYGVPRKANGEREDFCVIGYGKLGGLEMGYGSDLDLVFIYDGPREQMTAGERPLSHYAYFTRLAQRLVHILSIRTPAGRAYEVDLRLRPSGDAGLLVTPIDALRSYQFERAWTWEHQALVRARAVAGAARLAHQFEHMRIQVLAQPREPRALAADVLAMRERMRAALDHSHDNLLDVKQMHGGLIDIEFIAQFVALRYGYDCAELLMFSDTIRILETLESAGLAEYAQTRLLVSAYRAYRRHIHKQALQEQYALIEANELLDRRAAVQALWQLWIVDVAQPSTAAS